MILINLRYRLSDRKMIERFRAAAKTEKYIEKEMKASPMLIALVKERSMTTKKREYAKPILLQKNSRIGSGSLFCWLVVNRNRKASRLMIASERNFGPLESTASKFGRKTGINA